jgi:hypothetical protein
MTRTWVKPTFKGILTDNLEAFRTSNDLGESKDRTEVIENVAELIKAKCDECHIAVPEKLSTV